ncbi:MAG: hypothetical protein OZSIB_2204 [Candidatus Ozemobacter sibiricus]|uniref:SbsA Ig-like domain-containing protein n=1 Tax=Candidatus Ozemobacter sibiricus TaxID=2268124 RepID=A0A367ZT66_9BACT|nr:MAG: hypothetical protein OZSIB_2204 [Candidatus Ozemobacter sibiricus]
MSFFHRPLIYPSAGAWNPQTKEIYLEGPPWPGTPVTVEVTFPELATGQCQVSAANAAGGMIALENAVGVIASQSLATFTLAFDMDMRQASYSEWVGSSPGHLIRLLGPGDQPASITYRSGTARTISIGLLADLALETTYRFSIASGVITPSGTQLWGPATLSFTTQAGQTSTLASEVVSLTTFSDAARTIVIPDGSEINATTTLYFRMSALDPAPNTFDVATLTVSRNGSPLGTLPLEQPVIATTSFFGTTTTSVPWGGNHTLRFETASPTVANTFTVTFPGLVSHTPEPGSTGVRLDTPIVLTFTEAMSPATINSGTIRLHRSGTPVSFVVSSIVGATVTLRPDDIETNRLRPETTYTLEVGKWVTDLVGNPFVHSPATYTATFTTQASQTPPLSISSVSLFADAAFTQPLAAEADWFATGTVYIQMVGADGEPLTRDSTVASISGNTFVTLTEIASASGIYRGSYTFAGWPDRVPLRVQSVVTPTASQALLITYPRLSPQVPASDSTDVPVGTTIRIRADEELAAGTVTGTAARLLLGGTPVSATVSYDGGAREVVIDPTADLVSEGVYTVQVEGVRDTFDNPLLQPLVFTFQAADVIRPTLVGQLPPAGATGVTIDQWIRLTFSEPILPASVNASHVRLLRNGSLASFILSTSGATVTIDPDDAPDGGLRVETTYRVEVGPGVTDLKGNPFFNTPATYATIFSTQDAHTPPPTIDSFSLYRDPLRLSGYPANAAMPGTAAVYLKVTGTDGATQTRDVTTATLRLSWSGTPITIPLMETASNSGGLYHGEFFLASLPVYGFPSPAPPAPVGTLSWIPNIQPGLAATSTVRFPAWVPAASRLETLAGTTLASGASGVRLDTTIDLGFDSEIDIDSITPTALRLTTGGAPVPYSITWDAGGSLVTVIPDDWLLPGTTYQMEGPYAASGLRNPQGNPLAQPFAFTFQTQASQTPPVSIQRVTLYSNSGFTPASRLATGADYPATGTVYIEMAGVDGSPLTVDRTIASLSTGVQVPLTETGAATGLFRGSSSFAGLPDRFALTVQSLVSPTASQSLFVTYPRLTPLIPASGASAVSVFTTVVIEADEPLDPDSVSTAGIRILAGGSPVAAGLSYEAATRRLILTPAAALPYATTLVVVASGVRDLVGNPQATRLAFQFTTQATSLPPTTITALRVATSPTYLPALAPDTAVGPGQPLYIEVEGTDRSATTVDYTDVELLSDLRPDVATATLIEVGGNSGVFRGSLNAFPEEGARLTIRSVTDPTYRLDLRTLARPRFAVLDPASGSSDLPLDTLFTITTTKPVDPATALGATLSLVDQTGEVVASATWVTPTRLVVEGALATASPVHLGISGWRDTDGLAFPDLRADFTTRAASFSRLEVFSDAAWSAPVASGSTIEPGVTLWVRLTGRDLRTRQIETTTVQVRTGPASALSFPLTETAGGRFEGTVTAPTQAAVAFAIVPVAAPSLAQTFRTMEEFAVTSVTPASGATGVPADTWPTWTFSHPLTPAWDPTAPGGWFQLTKTFSPGGLPLGVPVEATYTISLDRRQVELRPWAIMELLAEYELRVSGTVRDERDRLLGTPFITRFRVQSPPPPPQEVSALRHYRDGTFTRTTDRVAPDGTLFLEVVARDQSFSTVDTTRVRITSSDGSLPGNEFTLVETSANSGIYRGALPVRLPLGTTISIQSQGRPIFLITVTVEARPRLIDITPASGAADLYLDQSIALTFDQDMDPTTLASGVLVTDAAGLLLPVTRALGPTNRVIRVAPTTAWPMVAPLRVALTADLFGATGIAPVSTAIGFSTRAPTAATVEALSGLPPRSNQAVSRLGEALPGPLTVVATTTDLYQTIPETRRIELHVDGTLTTLDLAEVATQPGTFQGTAVLPDTRGAAASLTLDFAARPGFPFTIAALPGLRGVTPASGATGVGELPIIEASFTRPIPLEVAAGALELSVRGQAAPVRLLTSGGTTATRLQWEPTSSLPPGSVVRATFRGLVDQLGQPVTVPDTMFTIVGSDGIVIYEDPEFQRPILGAVVTVPTIFVEATASGPWTSPAHPVLTVTTQLAATAPRRLALEGAARPTRRFQCQIDLEASRRPPIHLVPLAPGERAELSSPFLTPHRRVFHYKVRGDTPPATIQGLALFRDGHYQQRIEGDLHQAQVFVQIAAEDLNWVFPDTTVIRATSEADPSGLELVLRESGIHTGLFRNGFTLGAMTIATGSPVLRARPGDVITLTSITDPRVAVRVRYLPETRLEHAIAWPSPARGDTVTFSFYLTFPADVELSVYDTAGDEVHFAVIRGRAGENRYAWRLPRRVANGVYFFELRPTPHTEYQTKQKKVRGRFAVLR